MAEARGFLWRFSMTPDDGTPQWSTTVVLVGAGLDVVADRAEVGELAQQVRPPSGSRHGVDESSTGVLGDERERLGRRDRPGVPRYEVVAIRSLHGWPGDGQTPVAGSVRVGSADGWPVVDGRIAGPDATGWRDMLAYGVPISIGVIARRVFDSTHVNLDLGRSVPGEADAGGVAPRTWRGVR